MPVQNFSVTNSCTKAICCGQLLARGVETRKTTNEGGQNSRAVVAKRPLLSATIVTRCVEICVQSQTVLPIYHENDRTGCCIQLGPQSVAGQNVMQTFGNNSFVKRRMRLTTCHQQYVTSQLHVEQVLLL